MQLTDLFVRSKHKDTVSPEGGECDGRLNSGLAVMMLAQNVRDWGSIPCWGTEFFDPSEPTVTLKSQKVMVYCS